MNHKEEEAIRKLIGSVVTGNKPWNSEYNVGLVVDHSIQENEPATVIKIMWMNPKDTVVEKRLHHQLMDKYVYTWEHPTSVHVLSRNECNG